MGLRYLPPACGNDAVTNTVPAWPDFFGWKCGDCGGPLRLTDYAAHLMTGHPDETGRPGDALLVHDLKSDFYGAFDPEPGSSDQSERKVTR